MRRLKIGIVSVRDTDDFYWVRVLEQTHRNKEFAKGVVEWQASNGWRICSCSYPEFDSRGRTLFVRGNENEFDDDKFPIPKKHYVPVKDAVAEYNVFLNQWKSSLLKQSALDRYGVVR